MCLLLFISSAFRQPFFFKYKKAWFIIPQKMNHFIISCHGVCILKKINSVGETSKCSFDSTCPRSVSSGHRHERISARESSHHFQPLTRKLPCAWLTTLGAPSHAGGSIRPADHEGTFWMKVTDYIMIYLIWDGKRVTAEPDTPGRVKLYGHMRKWKRSQVLRRVFLAASWGRVLAAQWGKWTETISTHLRCKYRNN